MKNNNSKYCGCVHQEHKEKNDSTAVLEEEHQVILRMLNYIEIGLKKLEDGKAINLTIFENGIDFIRNFADKCHHGKEEDLLFVKAIEKGIPKESGPIGMMLYEHELGREFIKKSSLALKNNKNKELIDNLRGYIYLMT